MKQYKIQFSEVVSQLIFANSREHAVEQAKVHVARYQTGQVKLLSVELEDDCSIPPRAA